jgi:glycosyltransferase involved in cell wall biosynthesis
MRIRDASADTCHPRHRGCDTETSMQPDTVSLIVTTYNWPQALATVLASARAQTRLPDEVIIADDGSGPDTRALLRSIATDFPVPLRHVWQEDQGFRAARARNLAICAASGDYVVLLDGDMVMHPHFISDHAAAAASGSFVQGSRVLAGERFSDRLLQDPRLRPRFFSGDIERRRHTLRLPLLSRLYLSLSRGVPRMIKSCNQGWWRQDLLRLNGFDERMHGWGREDDELALRAMFAGISCRQLRLSGLAFHLHHRNRHEHGESGNDAYLAQSEEREASYCEYGLDRHLADCAAQPAPDLRSDHGAGPVAY